MIFLIFSETNMPNLINQPKRILSLRVGVVIDLIMISFSWSCLLSSVQQNKPFLE